MKKKNFLKGNSCEANKCGAKAFMMALSLWEAQMQCKSLFWTNLEHFFSGSCESCPLWIWVFPFSSLFFTSVHSSGTAQFPGQAGWRALDFWAGWCSSPENGDSRSLQSNNPRRTLAKLQLWEFEWWPWSLKWGWKLLDSIKQAFLFVFAAVLKAGAVHVSSCLRAAECLVL